MVNCCLSLPWLGLPEKKHGVSRGPELAEKPTVPSVTGPSTPLRPSLLADKGRTRTST